MKRTNIVVAVIAAAVLLLTAGSAQTGSGEGVPGRWQLFAGEHWANAGKGSLEQKEILRIDTVTGETSVWRTGLDANGVYFNKWTPIGK